MSSQQRRVIYGCILLFLLLILQCLHVLFITIQHHGPFIRYVLCIIPIFAFSLLIRHAVHTLRNHP